MVNHVIAIDPGLVTSGTGIAYFNRGVLKKMFYVAPDKEATFKKRAEKIVNMILDNLTMEWPLADFIVETSYYKGKANIHHNKLLGVLDYMFGVNTIAPLSWKKALTGLGRVTWPEEFGWAVNQRKLAEKDRIKDEVIRIWGPRPEFKEEDVVDAVAIGMAYLKIKEEK